MKEKKSKPGSEEKIINAAICEFAANGFSGARIDTIAKKAKINKAMIYYHFKSKEVLYEKILTDIYSMLFNNLKSVVNSETMALKQFYELIEKYMNLLDGINQNYIRIMLREISDGGVYFKKLGIPNLVLPIMELVTSIVQAGNNDGTIKNLNERYTFLQIIGGIVLFNILRNTFQDSPMNDIFFGDNYLEEYKENLFSILKSGIETGGNKQ